MNWFLKRKRQIDNVLIVMYNIQGQTMKNILNEIKWFFIDMFFNFSDFFGNVSQKLFAPEATQTLGHRKHFDNFFTEWEKDSTTYEEFHSHDDGRGPDCSARELELNKKHQGL